MRDDLQLNRSDLDLIFTAIDALWPFEEATREISGEKFTTIAKVIPMIRGLKEQMSIKLKKKNCPMARELQTQLNQRFSCPEESFIWAASTFLDPRFKKLSFKDQKETLEAVKRRLSQQSPPPEPEEFQPEQEVCPQASVLKRKDSIWASHDEAVESQKQTVEQPTVRPVMEMDKYEKEIVLPRAKNPLLWWKVNGCTMPGLEKLAKKYLSCPATSTPSERLFSKAGELINQRRSNISDKNINVVLFLNKNLKW
ncbi:zinc finger BED domain-containing protein 4 [Elysia marginata]|uniref:Zinc finger BED domain-containing protein 4 n=1 Tax=Elysia marginata TaxID=1093978 RepID=A0AAV4FU26_9GAST|nr:zinc finger BED domain-containing protein 4 [Elysia marginata]